MTALDKLVRESVRHAREDLPYHQAVTYLQGLATSLEGHEDAVGALRQAVAELCECDRQLLLIQTGQMQLALTPALDV